MKIIHCADIHLGSQMDAHLPYNKVLERRAEIRNTFLKMIEYAKESEIRHIILAGDVFDSDRPLKKDRDLFYNVIKGSSEITFYYLRGNHDAKENFSPSELPNLKTFGDSWITYEAQGVTVSGIEITKDNSLSLYKTLSLDRSRLNIVVLHGQASDSASDELISLPLLRDKGIDYLALGHIHSYSSAALDRRGEYVYSGCLEGRGFDECGKKGFVVIDTEGGKISHRFVHFAGREIKALTVDISDCDGVYSTLAKIRISGFSRDDIIRVTLVGAISFDASEIEDELARMLEPYCYFARIKNKTRRALDVSEIEKEMSLKGEFIRVVMQSDLSDDDKSEVINLGLAALTGADI